MKGYATVSDIRKFIPCGYEKAKEIYKQEKEKTSGNKKAYSKGIESKKLLPYVYLSEYEIKKYAEQEEMENR